MAAGVLGSTILSAVVSRCIRTRCMGECGTPYPGRPSCLAKLGARWEEGSIIVDISSGSCCLARGSLSHVSVSDAH